MLIGDGFQDEMVTAEQVVLEIGPRSGAAPGHLSQGRTQRVPDGRLIWPQYLHTVSAKHSSAMGAGACSRENHLGAYSSQCRLNRTYPRSADPGIGPKHPAQAQVHDQCLRSNKRNFAITIGKCALCEGNGRRWGTSTACTWGKYSGPTS